MGIYMLRAAELGIKLSDMGEYRLGELTDMFTEKGNDYEEYPEEAGKEDIHKFFS